MNLKFLSALLPLLFLGAIHAVAQLTWDKTEIDAKPTIDDANAIAVFPFKNSGNYPVTISNVTTSCPCTTGSSDKKTYNPGEAGSVTAIFGIGAVDGILDERITIETDDKANPFASLTMKVFLPPVLKLSPSTVSWDVGDLPTPKSILVDVVADHEINVTEALWIPRSRSHFMRFIPTLQTLVPHQRYRVTISPQSTASPAEEVIAIVTDYPKFQVKRVFATAVVKTPAQPAQ